MSITFDSLIDGSSSDILFALTDTNDTYMICNGNIGAMYTSKIHPIWIKQLYGDGSRLWIVDDTRHVYNMYLYLDDDLHLDNLIRINRCLHGVVFDFEIKHFTRWRTTTCDMKTFTETIYVIDNLKNIHSVSFTSSKHSSNLVIRMVFKNTEFDETFIYDYGEGNSYLMFGIKHMINSDEIYYIDLRESNTRKSHQPLQSSRSFQSLQSRQSHQSFQSRYCITGKLVNPDSVDFIISDGWYIRHDDKYIKFNLDESPRAMYRFGDYMATVITSDGKLIIIRNDFLIISTYEISEIISIQFPNVYYISKNVIYCLCKNDDTHDAVISPLQENVHPTNIPGIHVNTKTRIIQHWNCQSGYKLKIINSYIISWDERFIDVIFSYAE